MSRRQARTFRFFGFAPSVRASRKGLRRRQPAFDVLETRRLLAGGPPALPGPWTQAYDETWNGINPSVWTNALFWGGDDKTYAATFLPENATTSGGILSLTEHNQATTANDGTVEPLSSARLQSGGIQGQSAPGFAFEYGYISAEVESAPGEGIWSALYMLPVSHQDGLEIDVFENPAITPTEYTAGFHDDSTSFTAGTTQPIPFNDQSDFHNYAVDWEPGSLTFYVDGVETFHYAGSDVPSQPMYPILNLDAENLAGWTGSTTNALPTASMRVTSVQVWQHNASFFLAGQGSPDIAPAPGQFGDPSFEQIPVVSGTAAFHPSSFYWRFNDQAGLASNGSGLGSNAPDGSQAAVLAGTDGHLGSISQTLSVATTGTYAISFQAAQGTGSGSGSSSGVEPIAVSVDGNVVGTITPTSTAFQTYTTPSFRLSPGPHTFAFTATDGAGEQSSLIDTVSLNLDEPPPAPAAPGNLTAKAAAGGVNLSWTENAAAAPSFLIEESTNGTNFDQIATAPAGATAYLVTGLTPGTTYTFRIRATSAAGSSDYSNTASAMLPNAPPAGSTGQEITNSTLNPAGTTTSGSSGSSTSSAPATYSNGVSTFSASKPKRRTHVKVVPVHRPGAPKKEHQKHPAHPHPQHRHRG